MAEVLTRRRSLMSYEVNIQSEIKGKELWGDIDVSIEDYEELRDCIKEKLQASNVSILKIARDYPLSLTTFMVFLVRYKFNFNFWSLMGDELAIKINPNNMSELGLCAKKTFSGNGFDFGDCSEDSWTNLAPIFYEAGIPPESCFDDLFYVLSYDNHSLFDPQLIIDDLLETRSYQIRKPMARFLKRFKGDRAVEFVVDLHDAMLCVDQNMSGASQYVSHYENWKEKQKSKEAISSRKKQEYQTKPYLYFDNNRKGLCIVLPYVVMRDEWIEDVVWRITDERGYEIKKHMNITGDEGSRFISSILVPVSPSKNYIITLSDAESIDDTDIISWTIDGIKNNGAVYFNPNGRMITANYLTYPYGVMIFGDESGIVDSGHVSVVDQAYPTNRSGYRITALEPEGSNAYIKYLHSGEERILRVRPQIDMRLSGKTLFSLPAGTDFNLFTDIPELTIDVDNGSDVTGLELRIGEVCLPIFDLFENDTATIPLKRSFRRLFHRYGTYSLKLYQFSHFLKQIEFSYLPNIKTNYDPDIAWSGAEGYCKSKHFSFRRSADYSLEFENCEVITDEEYYTINCAPKTGTISVAVRSASDDDYYFAKAVLPVNPFEFEIVNSSGDVAEQTVIGTQKLNLEDMKENEYWLSFESFGKYKETSFSVVLRTVNGVEQAEHLSLTRNGSANFNLAAFYDTLSNSPLPARLEICCNGDLSQTVPVLILRDGVSLKSRPQYHPSGKVIIGIKDDGKNLTLRKFGLDKMECRLDYKTAFINKKGDGVVYSCAEPLQSGLYVVECSNTQSDFEFEDESGVVPTNGSNTFFISSRIKGAPVNTFTDWIDEYISIVLKAGKKHDITEIEAYYNLPEFRTLKSKVVDRTDYEKLIALAYFAADSKCFNKKKESMLEVMSKISVNILRSTSRRDLIRALAELNCPQDVFNICLVYYNLYLFENDVAGAKRLADKIENSCPELSLLLRLGCDDSIRNTVWREKFREIIGKEAIRALITVPDEENKEIVNEEIKKFAKEQAGCRVRIMLTKDISGDMGPIQKMIVYPEASTRSPYLDVSKKPDVGIYFDHIRYVDQYINWYKTNHDRDGNMNENTRDKMVFAVKNYASLIYSGFKALKHDPNVGAVASRYEQAIKARYDKDVTQNLTIPIPHRFFYLQAMAALIVMLPSSYRMPNWNATAAEQYISTALIVAPKISRRDLLMASTFAYLVRKEEKLCQ